MSEIKPKVEMIRLETPTTSLGSSYNKKSTGRETTSVFPNEGLTHVSNKKENDANPVLSSRFVSQDQLEKNKASRGESLADGTVQRDRSLAEILAENKKKKDEEFQETWRLMKQGKNRAFTEQREQDEVEFLDTIEKRQKQVEDTAKEQEERELLAFRLRSAVAKENALKEDGKASESRPGKTKRPPSSSQSKPKVILVPKKSSSTMQGPGNENKRLKTADTEDNQQAEDSSVKALGNGLAGIADYNSDDSD